MEKASLRATEERTVIFGTPLKSSDIGRFIASFANGKGECSVCGNNDWVPILSPPGTNDYLVLTTAGAGGAQGAMHLPSYAICCVTCGQYRIFAANQLIDWVKENPSHV